MNILARAGRVTESSWPQGRNTGKIQASELCNKGGGLNIENLKKKIVHCKGDLLTVQLFRRNYRPTKI